MLLKLFSITLASPAGAERTFLNLHCSSVHILMGFSPFQSSFNFLSVHERLIANCIFGHLARAGCSTVEKCPLGHAATKGS